MHRAVYAFGENAVREPPWKEYLWACRPTVVLLNVLPYDVKFESNRSQLREFMSIREVQRMPTLVLQGNRVNNTESRGHRDDQRIAWSERQSSSKERRQTEYTLVSFGCKLGGAPAWPHRWEKWSVDKLDTADARALATSTSKSMTSLLVQLCSRAIAERTPSVRVFPTGTSSSSTAPREVVDAREGPPRRRT